MPRRPIFLHTGWRTAGTWLWSRMRNDPAVVAFYEPLNEALASIGTRDLRDFRTDSWESRHPFQQRAYYAEFAPFVGRWRRGVARYDERFALDRWFGDADDAPRGLRDYIAMLVAHAEAQDRVGVFKFTRTLGRLAWMRQAFPDAAHVVVVRNPLDQWRSAWDQAMHHGNPYFLIMPWLALHRNAGNAAVASTAALLGVTPLDFGGGRLQRQYDEAAGAIANIDPEASYRAFLVTWILGMIDALRYGEVIVDIDALRDDDAYRPHLERSIAQHTGLHVDLATFEGSRRDVHESVASALDFERVHRDARPVIAAACNANRSPRRVSVRCIQLLDRRGADAPDASLASI